MHWLKGGCSNIRFTFFIQPKRELLEGLNNLPIINQTFLYKNVPLIFGMGPPFRTFWKSWFEEQGGYIMPGNRPRGSSDRVLVGSSRRGTAGQFRRIVVNKSVVKPLCDQLLSGDEGEGGDLEYRGGQVFGAL